MSSRISHWRRANEQLLLNCLDTEEPCSPEEVASDRDEVASDRDEDKESDDLSCSELSPTAPMTINSDPGSFDSPNHLSVSSIFSSSSDEDIINKAALLSDLANWSISHNISHNSLNDLMKLLQKNVNPNLPSDARTVLNTPRSIPIASKFGGEYVYLGIKSGVLECPALQGLSKISLVINVDGLPLFKSADVEVWPILGLIEDSNSPPFIIALWSGSGKPNCVDDFLKDFLTEYASLSETGIETERGMLQFSLRCFSCDAPARQYLKCTKGHTGYYACERCSVEGEMHDHTMTFEITDAPLRTDGQFSACNYSFHQHKKSILIDYGFPCVSKFVLDYMHLVCLGVVRRMLNFFHSGPRICKLSQQHLQIISERLHQLRNQLPSEFPRQPRSLKHLKRWKATEFKQFLLYTGIHVLKNIVTKEIYEHFLCLSISISTLLYFKPDDPTYLERFHFTTGLLKWFVDSSPQFYGSKFVSYNVHNLIHLHQDVLWQQCGLERVSAFPFENFLHRIKRMVRKSHQPLAQIARRIKEIESSDYFISSKITKTKIQPVTNKCYKNSWFFLKNNKICEVVGHHQNNNTFRAKLYSFERCVSYFKRPIDSKLMHICFLPKHCNFVFSDIVRSDIAKKFVPIPEEDGLVLIPILHDISF